eukprot:136337-Chlamydomonas_euryale.AAC.1
MSGANWKAVLCDDRAAAAVAVARKRQRHRVKHGAKLGASCTPAKRRGKGSMWDKHREVSVWGSIKGGGLACGAVACGCSRSMMRV